MITDKKTVKVWDLPVRVGHWTLVIAFFTAYFTEDDLLDQHVWAGYVVSAYLLIRVFWGFAGSKYARFKNYIYPLATIIRYMKNLFMLKPQHYIGHNPAGGAMVLALLISLTGTILTGMKLYAVEENKGPFAITVIQIKEAAKAASPLTVVKADDAKAEESEFGYQKIIVNKDDEAFWEELHELFANTSLILVFLHVAGVMLSSIIDKDKLVKAMITGKKEIDDSYR